MRHIIRLILTIALLVFVWLGNRWCIATAITLLFIGNEIQWIWIKTIFKKVNGIMGFFNSLSGKQDVK